MQTCCLEYAIESFQQSHSGSGVDNDRKGENDTSHLEISVRVIASTGVEKVCVVVGRRAEPEVVSVDLVEARLRDGWVAGVESLDDRLVDVEGGHVVGGISETCSERSADVAARENACEHTSG